MVESLGGDALAERKRGATRCWATCRFLVVAKRLLVCSILVIIFCFFGSNLWLMSPWGTGMAERNVQERLGLECEVGSMTWSPWNGITVNQLRFFMPGEDNQSVLDIESVRVRPYWRPLLQRKLQMREVRVNQPRIELPIEMLTALPADADRIEERPPIPPALAANQAQSIPRGETTAEGISGQVSADSSAPKPSLADYANIVPRPVLGSQVLAKPKPLMKAPDESGVPEVERPPAGAPMRLLVNDASIRLFSMSRDFDLVNVNQVSIDLPLSGKDDDGFIKVAGIEIPGVTNLPGFEQKVVWKRPRLEIEEQEVDLGFAKIDMRVQLGVEKAQSRLPFLVDMVIRPQTVDSVAWFERQSMHASAGMVTGRFRLLGLLSEPLGWKGEGVFAGENITVQAGEGRPRVTFDTVFLPAILQAGKLHWLGFRMLGEDFSILGNGRLSMRGGIVSVTRLVAAPEVAEVMEKSLSRAGMVDASWWYDMYTPDRKVRDLIVSGNVLNPLIDVGPRHARLPLSHLLHLIMNPGKNKIMPKVPVIKPQSPATEAEQPKSEVLDGPEGLEQRESEEPQPAPAAE
jgi:hypothetical protein